MNSKLISRVMCLVAASCVMHIAAPSQLCFAKRSANKKSSSAVKAYSNEDLATADGSLRAGLHNGVVYGVLVGLEPSVQLSPDSWANDDEPKRWNLWLVDFDNSLFSNWANIAQTDGQETVVVHITGPRGTIPGGVSFEEGRFFGANPDQRAAFSQAIRQSLEKTFKEANQMPATQNPLKEIKMALTFMRDPSQAPRYAPEQLGFLAKVDQDGRNITVYGRMKEGRSPGIQIVSDSEGGNIKVTDDVVFQQNILGQP